MRFKSSLHLFSALTMLGSLSLPAFADDTQTAPPAQQSPQQTVVKHKASTQKSQASNKRRQEKMAASRAFHHLSDHGQRAMVSILEAQQLLNAGNIDAAIPALTTASHHLAAAATAKEKFTEAEEKLHPQLKDPSKHQPIQGTTDWIPVGGEFIANETLAPEKKARVANANAQLKAGKVQEAAQTMQVVGDDIDFIIALAPLSQTQGTINRALIFAQSHDVKLAQEAITDSLNSLIYVSEDVVIQKMPGKNSQPTPSKQ